MKKDITAGEGCRGGVGVWPRMPSINALKKAYPNYFLDTQNFANLLIGS